ncbi:selenium-binding [Brachionus plicatilis]|uniref:Selenium-binding n=1 Tax=Brachionus plicatilis TaxID=10195 RepID=A0A3M7SHW4_BRAPC|nr:selenium-binding [Brachionus plicatilis]
MSELKCCACGPGYKSPEEAIKAEKEKIVYTVLVYCGEDKNQPDCLATVDVDPTSPTYSKVIHTLNMKYVGDELHHFGWNACSSCFDDSTKSRRFIVLPGFKSSRIYIIDTLNERKPSIHKILEPEEIKEKANFSSPHTVHCLANGKIMISFLGDKNGDAPGGYLLLNSDFEIDRKWGENEYKSIGFNYDYWYQPYHNIMVSSEWSAPSTFEPGFDLEDVKKGKYGQKLYFWDWKNEKLVKTFDLGQDGLIPLELRFMHNPKSSHGYVGAALSSAVWHWWKEGDEWKIEKVIQVDPVNLDSWPFPVPALITDLLLSMDDRFMYFSNWLHGEIHQYNIEDPHKPKLVGKIKIGGILGESCCLKNKKLSGGPQMIQLSLDGQRLYVTDSLFSSWDDQFYPDIKKDGSYMIQINCDTNNGGLSLHDSFLVDFGKLDDGPFRAHETRYPGGDCTSDIWIA